MKLNNYSLLLFIILTASFVPIIETHSQEVVPEALTSGTLKEQMDFINEKTRIYENYRAIREDMFQKIRKNSLDSLASSKKEIRELKVLILKQGGFTDSLNSALEETKTSLKQITQTKDSIRLLGIEVNKIAYNAVMWLIVAVLFGALGAGFVIFKHNRSVTSQTKKNFEDLKTEFETYRKTSREAREKMSMAHFNEIKKLKGI